MADSKIIDTDISKEEIQIVKDLNACLCGPVTIRSIRRLHVRLLQYHHHDVANYPEQYEHLQCLKYNPEDPANSTLTVANDNIFDPSKTDQFPGVFVGVEGLATEKNIIGNDLGATEDNAGEHLAKITTFQLGIKHVMQNESQLLELAEMNMALLLAQAPNIRERMGLRAYEPLGFGKPKIIEAAPNRYFETTILININYSLSVTAFTESHRLKKVVTMLGQELAQ